MLLNSLLTNFAFTPSAEKKRLNAKYKLNEKEVKNWILKKNKSEVYFYYNKKIKENPKRKTNKRELKLKKNLRKIKR